MKPIIDFNFLLKTFATTINLAALSIVLNHIVSTDMNVKQI